MCLAAQLPTVISILQQTSSEGMSQRNCFPSLDSCRAPSLGYRGALPAERNISQRERQLREVSEAVGKGVEFTATNGSGVWDCASNWKWCWFTLKEKRRLTLYWNEDCSTAPQPCSWNWLEAEWKSIFRPRLQGGSGSRGNRSISVDSEFEVSELLQLLYFLTSSHYQLDNQSRGYELVDHWTSRAVLDSVPNHFTLQWICREEV